ncbi:MAG: hypothetical protein WC501_03785 [Candidatus Micrarchaeia archaeon]
MKDPTTLNEIQDLAEKGNIYCVKHLERYNFLIGLINNLESNVQIKIRNYIPNLGFFSALSELEFINFAKINEINILDYEFKSNKESSIDFLVEKNGEKIYVEVYCRDQSLNFESGSACPYDTLGTSINGKLKKFKYSEINVLFIDSRYSGINKYYIEWFLDGDCFCDNTNPKKHKKSIKFDARKILNAVIILKRDESYSLYINKNKDNIENWNKFNFKKTIVELI